MVVGALLSLTGQGVFADTLDVKQKGSISILLEGKDGDQTVPVRGAELNVYQVASVEENDGSLAYTYTDRFRSATSSLENIQSQSMIQELELLAINLEAPDYSGQTDEEGNLLFENIPLGLYLVIQPEPADGFYAIKTFLVSVPSVDQNGNYVYDVDASPKTELEKLPSTPSATTTVTVDGKKSTANASVIITKTSAEIVDTVHYFGFAKGQSYTAEASLVDLSDNENVIATASASFTVTSDTGNGDADVSFGTIRGLKYEHSYVVYETVYKGSGDTLDRTQVIAEHKDKSDKAQTFQVKETFPETPGSETPTPTPTPETPSTPGGHVPTVEKHTQRLPQTGQLWWPVPVLAAAGIALILIGRQMKKTDRGDHR